MATITLGKPEDKARLLQTLVLGFAADPMARWAFGDTRTYLAVMPAFVRAFGGNGLAHGATHLVDGGWAAAMWLCVQMRIRLGLDSAFACTSVAIEVPCREAIVPRVSPERTV